ncbi:MAG TPA: alpha-2-macroglobulin family protein [Kofleriaceae bacterium]
MWRTPQAAIWLALACTASCKMKGGDRERAEQMMLVTAQAGSAAYATGELSAAPAAAPTTPMREQRGGKAPAALDEKDRVADAPADKAGDFKNKTSHAGGETAARAWFPETFLFEPLVVTDDHGAATVPVRVPDRLTTWRVLALAHSRTGAQGGAVTSFLGTLPTYVDPIVPAFLIEGDEVRLPIQMVNTTAAEVRGALDVSVQNATIVHGPGRAAVLPAQGSALDAATLRADHAGRVALRVALAGSDAVERTFEVRPNGRPVTERRSGTLAAPRSFQTAGPPLADATTDRLRLRVFPGALALLRAELGVSASRGDAASDAYALLLAARAPALLTALGDKPDAEALRELAIVTGQRAVRAARTLDVAAASLWAEPALAHPESPVLARLGARAASYLADQQRPDGTFDGETGWTLQRLLVVTAAATRAVSADGTTPEARQRALRVATRAAGAFGRAASQVRDGYTAAAILASHAVSGELADGLRQRVRDAIKATPDGAYLAVEDGVVRADGTVPSRLEATALAVLALDGDPAGKLAELGTTLLGGYALERGWGDGATNLLAMQAVAALFKQPLPASIDVALELDGQVVAHGVLAGDKRRDVLALDAAVPTGLAGAHTWKLTASPAVPGLGYALALDSWVPWDRQAVHDGLELALPARVAARVGVPSAIAVTAVAPSGLPLHVQQALPAGVQVDRPSLDALVSAGALLRYVAADGTLDLYAPALSPGQTFSVGYRLIPTLAGTLHTGASLLEAGAAQFRVPPAQWDVR